MKHSFGGEGDKENSCNLWSTTTFLKWKSALLLSMWFREEVQFHVNGYVNKWNVRLLTTETLRQIMKTPLHS
jgi:hypothetical protein